MNCKRVTPKTYIGLILKIFVDMVPSLSSDNGNETLGIKPEVLIHVGLLTDVCNLKLNRVAFVSTCYKEITQTQL